MGSKDSGSETTIRFPAYIEDAHKAFLKLSSSAGITARANNPYTSFVDFDYDDAFYGAGYTISSFPSLYDMYGKFMAGLDVESLFEQMLHDVQNTETIQAASVAHRDLLDDDIEENILPRFKAGMRDINSVMASSFVIGQSIIESARVKKLAEFDADLRYKLVPVAAEVFNSHLTWNKDVIKIYIEVMKTAMAADMEQTKANYEMAVAEAIWPFTILDYERANIGALQGASTSKTTQEESPLGAIISGIGLVGALLL